MPFPPRLPSVSSSSYSWRRCPSAKSTRQSNSSSTRINRIPPTPEWWTPRVRQSYDTPSPPQLAPSCSHSLQAEPQHAYPPNTFSCVTRCPLRNAPHPSCVCARGVRGPQALRSLALFLLHHLHHRPHTHAHHTHTNTHLHYNTYTHTHTHTHTHMHLHEQTKSCTKKSASTRSSSISIRLPTPASPRPSKPTWEGETGSRDLLGRGVGGSVVLICGYKWYSCSSGGTWLTRVVAVHAGGCSGDGQRTRLSNRIVGLTVPPPPVHTHTHTHTHTPPPFVLPQVRIQRPTHQPFSLRGCAGLRYEHDPRPVPRPPRRVLRRRVRYA